MVQGELFENPQRLPQGFIYQPDFITSEDEAELLGHIRDLPLSEAKYKQYTAKRRIVSYGGRYDYSTNELLPAGPIPAFLDELLLRIAKWVQLPAEQFTHALIAEYKTGTQLGWHRDVPEFEVVVGVSVGGSARMRLRPYPPTKGRSLQMLSLELEPRSAYVMRGHARWGWQHSIAPTKVTRYSITFRTRSGRRGNSG